MAAVLIDGFSTRVELEGCSLTVCEKTVTPPEIDAGSAIDITDMNTTLWRMKAPKYLLSLNPMTFTAAYDPVVFNQAAVSKYVGMIQQVTIAFPDGSLVIFYGYIEKVTFMEIKEGEQPICTVTITPTNWSGTFSAGGCPTETAPVYVTPTEANAKGGFRTC